MTAVTTVTQSTATIVLVAIIGLVSAAVASVVPRLVLGRQRSRERSEDRKDRDAVAKRAEQVAEKVEELRVDQEKAARDAAAKMDMIVHQTDGLYTASLEAQLRYLMGTTQMLREVLALRKAADPEADATLGLAELTENEKAVSVLKETLDRRIAYQNSLQKRPLSELAPERAPQKVEIVNPEPVDVAVVPKP